MESQFTISGLLFIICLIVPGVIFKRFYFQGQFSKQFGAGLFADRLITSIFWGIIVQITTYLVFSKSLDFSYKDIQQKVEITYKNIFQNTLPNLSYKDISWFLLYLLASIFVASLLGNLLHQLVTILKLDIRYKVIRFENEWHYYFTGRILYEADFKSNKKGKVLSVNVDLVVNDGSEGNKMISGYLTQYTISPKTGQLDLICLTSAKRWSKRQKMLVDVPGDCFIVPYEKVVDFNLTYNMPVINQGRRAKVFNTLSMLGFIVIIFATFYPWFLNLSIFKKFLSSIFLTASALWFLLFLLNNFQPNPSSKLKIGGLIICLILFVIFGWLAILNMNLQTGIYQLLQHIYYCLPFTNLSK